MINKNKTEGYCKDYTKIENYEKAIVDTTQTWHCHHRNERFYTKQELIDLGLYFDCPPCELIFLTVEEHGKQYHKGRSDISEKRREHMSKAKKGVRFSDEHIKNLSTSIKISCKDIHKECREAYKASGRKDWNTFQKEYYKENK